MDSVYQTTDRVYRTRQLALLLSERDRATVLAYAAELERAASSGHLPSDRRPDSI